MPRGHKHSKKKEKRKKRCVKGKDTDIWTVMMRVQKKEKKREIKKLIKDYTSELVL